MEVMEVWQKNTSLHVSATYPEPEDAIRPAPRRSVRIDMDVAATVPPKPPRASCIDDRRAPALKNSLIFHENVDVMEDVGTLFL
jgi:hypothetical protein